MFTKERAKEQNQIIWMAEEIKGAGYNLIFNGAQHQVILPNAIVKRFGLSNIHKRFDTVQEAHAYFSGVRDALWFIKMHERD